jgi:hypothetical protein
MPLTSMREQLMNEEKKLFEIYGSFNSDLTQVRSVHASANKQYEDYELRRHELKTQLTDLENLVCLKAEKSMKKKKKLLIQR